MKKSFVFWVEKYFYNPNALQRLLSILLLPLSSLYCFLMWLRFTLKKEEEFGIKIISIGNLSVGGSGKTPLVTALALKYDDIAVVLRGYGRHSKGLVVVKDRENILCDVSRSGDEAMIYAHKLQNAMVVVSEDRKIAIHKAKEMGAKVIFLDDAYSKHDIKKLDILINVKSKNNFCLPSGPFRERLWNSKTAIVLDEKIHFKRVVELQDARPKMSLVTAIARPERLDEYLPSLHAKHCFPDHYSFKKEELEKILKSDGVDSLLVTYKDFVKVQGFGLPLSLLDMHMEVDDGVLKLIHNYISSSNE